ncbi:MAG: PASTA domain-containing protein [Melioribacteraceae bacterium]|jgi:serine/threonine-protein kinase|nr:PASTA domain-containing protein [Melioribacteraceae bacterium]
MKTKSSIILKKAAIYILVLIGTFLLIDKIVLPFYISGTEIAVPNLVGKHKDDAVRMLEDANLQPIVQTSRFDENISRDHVMFQKPNAGALVKENRRIYLTISGGSAQIRVPSLISKTVRDASLTLERMGLKIGNVDPIESEFPADLIVEQSIVPGREVDQGSVIHVKISIGPQIGMIRVPNILGKSLAEAENILRLNSLHIGTKTYIYSSTLLPNTIVDQQPSENSIIAVGDSISVVLSQSRSGG